MAKRSPILGYNHNVRYRGLVFHVQTEDSGIASPHVFTHLFHGGVILSTRKLVYDSGSSEEVIRSLMQAQHKAVLKELRRGVFDDKIDEYLGSNPELQPRDTTPEVIVEEATDEAVEMTPAPAPPPAPPPREKTGPVPPIVTFRPDDAARDGRAPMAPIERQESGRIASMDAASLPPLPAPPQPTRGTVPRLSALGAPRPAITPPVVLARDLAAVTGEAVDSAEIYSPAPSSIEPPPGAAEHRGAYSVRRREATSDGERGRDGEWPRDGERLPRAASQGLPGQFDGQAVLRATSAVPPKAPSVPPTRAPTAQPPPLPARARAASPIPTAPRARPSGGVVMSRPAVIVGAPRTTPPPVRSRPSTEDERRGFGQGLISEKSLDEVILAYLSEDSNEE